MRYLKYRLAGYPVFFADSENENERVLDNIINWRETLEEAFEEIEIDPEAEDLIRGLLCEAKDRLRYEEIKSHPFFSDIDWNNLRNQEAPLKPNLEHCLDISHFPEYSLDVIQEYKEKEYIRFK